MGPAPATCSPPRRPRLEAAGAELLVLCTNTMHKVADQVQAAKKTFM